MVLEAEGWRCELTPASGAAALPLAICRRYGSQEGAPRGWDPWVDTMCLYHNPEEQLETAGQWASRVPRATEMARNPAERRLDC